MKPKRETSVAEDASRIVTKMRYCSLGEALSWQIMDLNATDVIFKTLSSLNDSYPSSLRELSRLEFLNIYARHFGKAKTLARLTQDHNRSQLNIYRALLLLLCVFIASRLLSSAVYVCVARLATAAFNGARFFVDRILAGR